MRMTWRMSAVIVLVGVWPHLGCLLLPGDPHVGDLSGGRKPPEPPTQELTAADIVQSWLAKADAFERTGQTPEAIAVYEKLRDAGGPQAPTVTKKLALLHDRSDDLDRAEQEYRRCLQHNPKDADALSNLGYIHYRRGHWGTAEKYLRDAVYHQPHHAYAWVNLGLTLAQQEEYTESVETLAKVVSKAEAYCHVAFVMNLQGKRADAMRAYQTALGLQPSLERARLELAKLQYAAPTDAPTLASRKTPPRTGQQGVVELESVSASATEGMSRRLLQRPTLPPLPAIELAPEQEQSWPTSGKKKS